MIGHHTQGCWTETGLVRQADASDLLEKMNVYCECMKGAAGSVAG